MARCVARRAGVLAGLTKVASGLAWSGAERARQTQRRLGRAHGGQSRPRTRPKPARAASTQISAPHAALWKETCLVVLSRGMLETVRHPTRVGMLGQSGIPWPWSNLSFSGGQRAQRWQPRGFKTLLDTHQDTPQRRRKPAAPNAHWTLP